MTISSAARSALSPVGLVVLASFLVSAGASPRAQAPCHHPELERFAFLEGNWILNIETRLADGRWETTSGSSSITRDLSGCLLTERLSSTRDGWAFEALAHFGFDNNSHLLQEMLSDSEHGLLALFQGPSAAGEINLDLTLSQPGGLKLIVRRNFSDIASNSFRVESRRSTDDGQTWTTVTRVGYTRRK